MFNNNYLNGSSPDFRRNLTYLSIISPQIGLKLKKIVNPNNSCVFEKNFFASFLIGKEVRVTDSQ
jgi:hypothetical protein